MIDCINVVMLLLMKHAEQKFTMKATNVHVVVCVQHLAPAKILLFVEFKSDSVNAQQALES